MLYINKVTDNPVIDFAAEELKKYLRMMMPESGDVKIVNGNGECGFRLGVMADFGLDTSDVADTTLDDILYANCNTGGGIIAGSNCRSVLLSVYEYLRKNGCKWLFPGVDGEFIPLKSIGEVSYRLVAGSRVRGNCIEGFTSQRMLVEFIDFLPKLGLNTYMIQFRVPSAFYDRFYTHLRNNKNRPSEGVSTDQVVQWTAAIECEVSKRGLFLHSYGHGFTTDPFGIDSAIGWEEIDPTAYGDDVMKYYAMIDGKRQFFKNKPLNTQICMSNKEARRKIADYIVDYSRRHSNIDYLHIWLADGSNNHCECEECRKHRPSDLYVSMMNDIDDALTEAGLDTKLVVICYVDTFWAPIEEKLHTGNRFILMVAPITRDYTKDFDRNAPLPELRPYERNKLVMPQTLEENLAYYNGWKTSYFGDRFVFEYHFWRHQNFDPSGRMLAKRIYDDIKDYLSLGECGIIECGSQRSFFPNGYAFYTHARALFDHSLSLEEIEREYYDCAYGEYADDVRVILEKMREVLPYWYVSPTHADNRPERYAIDGWQERLSEARGLLGDMMKLVKEHYDSAYRVRTASVRLLECWSIYVDKLINVIEAVALDDLDGAKTAMTEFENETGKIEFIYEGCFDHGQAMSRLRSIIPAAPRQGVTQ